MPRKPADKDIFDFHQAIGLLIRRIRATAAGQELSLSERSVMSRLDNEGPATTADLARSEGVKPQSMGATVAALEERGLVERKAHPTDGRQVNIALTAKGAALRKTARDAKHSWLAQAISQLERSDQDTLFAASEIVKRLVKL